MGDVVHLGARLRVVRGDYETEADEIQDCVNAIRSHVDLMCKKREVADVVFMLRMIIDDVLRKAQGLKG